MSFPAVSMPRKVRKNKKVNHWFILPRQEPLHSHKMNISNEVGQYAAQNPKFLTSLEPVGVFLPSDMSVTMHVVAGGSSEVIIGGVRRRAGGDI